MRQTLQVVQAVAAGSTVAAPETSISEDRSSALWAAPAPPRSSSIGLSSISEQESADEPGGSIAAAAAGSPAPTAPVKAPANEPPTTEPQGGIQDALDPVFERSDLSHAGLLLDEEKPSTLEEFVAAVQTADLNESLRLQRNKAWERRHENSVTIRPVLYPRTRPKRTWDRFVSLSIIFHLLTNPLLLAFSDQLRTVLPTLLLVGCDFVYWIDILLTFLTAAEEYTGNHFDVVTVPRDWARTKSLLCPAAASCAAFSSILPLFSSPPRTSPPPPCHV